MLSAARWQLHPSSTYRLLCEIHRRITKYNNCFTPLELVLWSRSTLRLHLTEFRAEQWLLPFNTHLMHWVEQPLTLSAETGLPVFPEVIFPRAVLCCYIDICDSHLDTVLRAYTSPLVRGTYVEAPEDGTSRWRLPDLHNLSSRIATWQDLTCVSDPVKAFALFQHLEELQGYRILRVNDEVFII